MTRNYIAIDLGASSGRLCLGRLDGGKLSLEEIHRFANGAIRMGDALIWDIPALWANIVEGLRIAGQKYGNIVSIGVDTWGVDFALLDRNNALLGQVVSYRDSRTAGMMDKAFSIVPRSEIFQSTGLQFLPFNSLYQLLALKEMQSPLLEAGKSFLMVPDLIHFFLSGVKSNEFTNATTTQCFNPATGCWAWEMLSRFKLPSGVFGDISLPGTVLGPLRSYLKEETGLKSAQVVLPGTHDTASAVAAVPAQACSCPRPNWAYLSLGTWALMGIESPQPIINKTVEEFNFTNEGGVGRTYRVLKNITGLWMLQECRRIWNQSGKNYSWNDMTALAEQYESFDSTVNPDEAVFSAPENMPQAIVQFCRQSGQKVPQTDGEIIACVEKSLVKRFKQVLEMTEQINESPIEILHVIGGGMQNKRLCQLTANAINRPVAAGPIEATAIGNIIVQAIADAEITDINAGRKIIRDSFPLEIYMPQ